MEELEVLEAIYIDELEVVRTDRGDPVSITVQLHPSTGDEHDKKYVCLTLVLTILPQYPDSVPDICIKNPRGLGDEEICSLQEEMENLAVERKGGAMLFELIELAKDNLTEVNIPKCACMICLEYFHEDEDFTKTECYHYFHSHCLSRYITHCLNTKNEDEEVTLVANPFNTQAKQRDILCPVCRKKMPYEEDVLLCASSPSSDAQPFMVTESMRQWQREMAGLLKRQKTNGGIIDVDAEKTKFLVSAEDRVLLPEQYLNTEDIEREKNSNRKSEQVKLKKDTKIMTQNSVNSHKRRQCEDNRWNDKPRYYQSRQDDRTLLSEDGDREKNNHRQTELNESRNTPKTFSKNRTDTHNRWQYEDRSNDKSRYYRPRQMGTRNRNWRDQETKPQVLKKFANTANGVLKRHENEKNCSKSLDKFDENFKDDGACGESPSSCTTSSPTYTSTDADLGPGKQAMDNTGMRISENKNEREHFKDDDETCISEETSLNGKLSNKATSLKVEPAENLKQSKNSPIKQGLKKENKSSYKGDGSSKYYEGQRSSRNLQFDHESRREERPYKKYSGDVSSCKGGHNSYYRSANYNNDRPRSATTKQTFHSGSKYRDVDHSKHRSLDGDKSTNYRPQSGNIDNESHYHKSQEVDDYSRRRSLDQDDYSDYRRGFAKTNGENRDPQKEANNNLGQSSDLKVNKTDYDNPSSRRGDEDEYRYQREKLGGNHINSDTAMHPRKNIDSKSAVSWKSHEKPFKQHEFHRPESGISSTARSTKDVNEGDHNGKEDNFFKSSAYNDTGIISNPKNNRGRGRERQTKGEERSRKGFPPVPHNSREIRTKTDKFDIREGAASHGENVENTLEVRDHHNHRIKNDCKKENLSEKIASDSKMNKVHDDGLFIERKTSTACKVKPPPGFENSLVNDQTMRVNPPPGFNN